MRAYPDWQAVPAGDLLTVTAAARLEGVKRQSMLGRITSGAIPYIDLGGHYYVRRQDVAAWHPAKPGPKPKA
jgi:excisionase family DNA binding protein